MEILCSFSTDWCLSRCEHVWTGQEEEFKNLKKTNTCDILWSHMSSLDLQRPPVKRKTKETNRNWICWNSTTKLPFEKDKHAFTVSFPKNGGSCCDKAETGCAFMVARWENKSVPRGPNVSLGVQTFEHIFATLETACFLVSVHWNRHRAKHWAVWRSRYNMSMSFLVCIYRLYKHIGGHSVSTIHIRELRLWMVVLCPKVMIIGINKEN